MRSCGHAVMWLCGYVVMWLCGYVVMWLCGYVVMWLCGYVVMWLCGRADVLQRAGVQQDSALHANLRDVLEDIEEFLDELSPDARDAFDEGFCPHGFVELSTVLIIRKDHNDH
jgi:hypothetical protein